MMICDSYHDNPIAVRYVTQLFYDTGKKKWSAQIGISCPICGALLAFLDTNLVEKGHDEENDGDHNNAI